MSTRLDANIGNAFASLREQVARRLLAAAVTLSVEHQHRLNISNPRPHVNSSKPGEYPRKRTGYLQANVTYYPTTPSDVMLAGYVDVGYSENAEYGEWLVNRGRKGIEDTAEEIRAQLESIVAGSGSSVTGGAG